MDDAWIVRSVLDGFNFRHTGPIQIFGQNRFFICFGKRVDLDDHVSVQIRIARCVAVFACQARIVSQVWP